MVTEALEVTIEIVLDEFESLSITDEFKSLIKTGNFENLIAKGDFENLSHQKKKSLEINYDDFMSL
jgi:hypothetical protein